MTEGEGGGERCHLGDGRDQLIAITHFLCRLIAQQI